ncbi:MAG: ATP-binding cassette domain-containing protein [Planctomycetaceae bacterium]|nr:ATP-binding cassette domain-containing protein [Planctomycetaceae bacterium]
MEPVLSVRGLARSYGDTVAVAGLDFELYPGEILGLVGPNGAGKTTTLRTLSGVLPIQVGEVHIAGRDLAREELLAKRELAWVPDDPRPFESLTVFEHLEWTAALYRVPEWRPRAEELLVNFDLKAKQHALGGELSRGMRQKLSLAMAWLPRPKLVLMDEPLSGLDPLGIRAAKRSLLSLAGEGTAIVLSSHQLGLVEELASRLLVLSQGRAVFHGTLAEARGRVAEGSASIRTLEDLFLEWTAGDGEVPLGPDDHVSLLDSDGSRPAR